MKLSSLTPIDKIKLAAELDGLEFHYSGDGYCVRKGEPTYHLPPDYATSYDAIIPLIQKLWASFNDAQQLLFWRQFPTSNHWLMATPSQLLDALLVATGKAEM
jgi:hypothetical protein